MSTRMAPKIRDTATTEAVRLACRLICLFVLAAGASSVAAFATGSSGASQGSCIAPGARSSRPPRSTGAGETSALPAGLGLAAFHEPCAASAAVTNASSTTRLLASPNSGKPGTRLTVAGTGFAPDEAIALSFGGMPLAVNTAVNTDDTGSFFAPAAIPRNAFLGPNTLTATGTRSRAVATTTIYVDRPVASAWYFAGLDTRRGTSSRLALLNPDNHPAGVTVRVSAAGMSARDYGLVVPGHSRSTVDLARFTGRHALLYARVASDRRIAAAATTTRGAQDFASLAGVSSPQRVWYLPEGGTGPASHEYLRIYDPGGVSARVSALLLPRAGAARTIDASVGAGSGRELAINRYISRGEVGAVVRSNVPIVVERFMTFGHDNAGATASSGVTGLSSTWYFPEGSTTNGFLTFYEVLNSSRRDPAAVTATFYNRAGAAIGTSTVVVPPQRRGTIDPNGAVRSDGVIAVLTSNIPVSAERTMVFGARGKSHYIAGSVIAGRGSGALQWIFPEGDTGRGYRELLNLQNTSGRVALVGIEFYTAKGTATHADVSIPAHGRTTLDAGAVPGLGPGQHGAVLTSNNGAPFVAEQSLYSADGRRGDGMVGIAQ